MLAINVMDPQAIRAKAASRRSSGETVGWKCNYCHHTFVREKSYINHQCKAKKRLELVKTPTGQMAWACYNDWFKLRGFSVQNVSTFMTSSKFTSFYKFAEYCEKLNINAADFVKFVVTRHPDIDPPLWCSNSVYVLYLAYYDNTHDPWEQVIETQKFIDRQAEILECDVTEVFKKMGLAKIIEAYRLRKLSAWYLLTSKSATAFIRSLDMDDLNLLSDIINFAVWAERFDANPEFVRELNSLLV